MQTVRHGEARVAGLSEVKRVGFGGYKDGLWTHMPGLPWASVSSWPYSVWKEFIETHRQVKDTQGLEGILWVLYDLIELGLSMCGDGSEVSPSVSGSLPNTDLGRLEWRQNGLH